MNRTASSDRRRILLLAAVSTVATGIALSFAFAYPWPELPYFAIDFTVFFAAARALARGLSPYDMSALEQFAPAGAINAVLTYSYPPLLAQLLAPLTAFPLETAARLWTAFNLLAPGAAVAFLAASAGWRARPLAWAILILGATLFLPAVYTYLSGQASLWILACLSLAIGLEQREHHVTAGVLAGLALVKLHPLLLLPVAFWLRDRKALLAGGVATLVSLVLAASFISGLPEAMLGAFSANNVSMDEVLYQATPILYPPGAALAAITHLLVVGAAVAMVAWLHQRGVGWRPFWAAATAVGLLAAPYLGRSDVALALIPLTLILTAEGRLREPKLLALLAWAVPLLAVMAYSFLALDAALLPRVWGSVTLWITTLAALWFAFKAPTEPRSNSVSMRLADS